MKNLFKIASIVAAIFAIGFGVANADTNFWLLDGGNLKPIFQNASIKIPSLTNKNCLGTDINGVIQTGTCTGTGGTFPFTPTSYGNSTSTTIGFLQGLFSVGSTTISGLSSGLVGNQNGLLYSFASSSLFGFTPANNATTITINGTTNQITSSAGAQDLSANRTWTLSIPAAFQFPLSYTSTYGTTTYASSTALTATNLFSTTASSTNYYGGFLTSCNGATNALTWSSGQFGCNSITPTGNVGNWFTPQTWGNSTSTTIGFNNGIIVNAASSTFAGSSDLATTTVTQSFVFAPNGNCSGSESVGGCVRMNFSNSNGGLHLFSSNTSGAPLFDVDFTGATANTQPLRVESSATNASAVNVQGAPDGLGLVKLGPGTSGLLGNNSSSILSIDAFTGPYNGQAIFMKCRTGTTTPCIQQLDENSNQMWVVDSNGNSTTTGMAYAATASSTKLFGADLSPCTGTNALTWSGGLFTCTAQPQGTVTSVTGDWPIISSGGTTPNITFGGLSTSSPLAAASGILYATGVNTVASVSTSSAINLSITGNAGTATALASDGANCGTGFFPLGVDASGASQSCTYAVATTTPWGANQFVYTNSIGQLVSAASSSLNLPNTALTNSSITINGAGGITGGGSVALGSSLTLTAPFAWTPTSWGNSTSSTLGLTNGIIVNAASSTFTGGAGLATTTIDQGIKLSPSGSVSASVSAGGVFNLTNTNNDGAGMVLFTNHASGATGRLFSVDCNSATFDQNCVNIQSAGTQSVVNISGGSPGLGIVKIAGLSGAASTNSSAALSIDSSVNSYQGQGIFTKCNSATTTPCLIARDSGSNLMFSVDGNKLTTMINASTTQQSTSGFAWFTGGIIDNSASTTINGNATTTGTFFASIASSTNLYGADLASCTGGTNALTWSGGLFGCQSITAGGAFAFTPATNFAVNFNSTTTPIWFKNPVAGSVSLAASSTSWFDQINVGSTTSGTMATSTDFGNFSVSGGVQVGQLYIPNGSATNPSIAFTTEPGTGFFNSNPGNGRIGITLAGTSHWTIDTNSFRSTTGGAVGTPAFSVGSSNTGMFSTANNVINFGTNGIEVARFDSSQRFGLGTTSPNWLMDIGGTRPSIDLSDTGGGLNLKHWLISSMGGNLYVGTSTDTYATSTIPAFSILNGGNFGFDSLAALTQGLSIGTSTVFTSQYGGSYASSTSQAANYTVNWETGNSQRFILNQNTTFVINATSSYPRDGFGYTLKLCQDATGGRTATFVTPGQLIWEGGNRATTTAASAAFDVTMIALKYDARVAKYDVVASSTTGGDTRSCKP